MRSKLKLLYLPMMPTFELKPTKSMTESIQLDIYSDDLFKSIINKYWSNENQREERGTLPQINSYADMIDEEECVKAFFTVQIKQFCLLVNKNSSDYGIPSVLLRMLNKILCPSLSLNSNIQLLLGRVSNPLT